MFIMYSNYMSKTELKKVNEAVIPTNDFVFKKIFGEKGNENITKHLIECITNDKIETVNLDGNRILDKDIFTDKVSVLDVRAVLNSNVEVDIEMQVASKDDIEKRILFYWAKLHTKTVVAGDNYEDVKRTIAILIADFEIEKLKDIPKYHTKWKILESEFSKNVLTENFEIDIIEIPKVKKCIEKHPEFNKNKELLIWMKFFTNPNSLEENDMENNEAVKKAKEELDEIAQDEHDALLAEMRLKYIRDKHSELKYATRKGREQGLEEGAKAEKIEIARKMLKDNVNIEDIIHYTNLTKKEIENLK